MEKEELKQLYADDDVARMFFDDMANRQRNQSETKVDRIMQRLREQGNSPSRGDIIALFKKLEEYKCGQFVAGRHGWPSRFIWDVGSLSASRFAVGETEEVEEITQEPEEGAEGVESLNHTFNLRPDLPVEFELPIDLTEKEAERLAGFLKTLPMEDYD